MREEPAKFPCRYREEPPMMLDALAINGRAVFASHGRCFGQLYNSRFRRTDLCWKKRVIALCLFAEFGEFAAAQDNKISG